MTAVLARAVPAAAEQQATEAPIGRFVVDVRGSLAPYGQDPVLAANIGAGPSDMPRFGLGLDVGGHWYFLRWKVVTFGIGASLHLSSAEHQTPADPEKGILEGPKVRMHLRTVVPQLSFNFGKGDGWSYLSGGMSNARLGLTKNGVEQPTVSTKTINYGGGARWFTSRHVAFSLDLRFYAMNPVAGDAGVVGQSRTTRMVFSAGVSVK